MIAHSVGASAGIIDPRVCASAGALCDVLARAVASKHARHSGGGTTRETSLLARDWARQTSLRPKGRSSRLGACFLSRFRERLQICGLQLYRLATAASRRLVRIVEGEPGSQGGLLEIHLR